MFRNLSRFAAAAKTSAEKNSPHNAVFCRRSQKLQMFRNLQNSAAGAKTSAEKNGLHKAVFFAACAEIANVSEYTEFCRRRETGGGKIKFNNFTQMPNKIVD